MTHYSDWVFHSEDRFYHQAETQVNYYDENQEFLEIPSAKVTNLKAEFQKYKSDYELYLASNKSATKPDTIKRSNHRKVITNLLRDFYNLYVRLNPKVKDEDRAANYFPVFDTQKTSVHVPELAPEVEIEVTTHLWHHVLFGVKTSDNNVERGLPKGASGVQIWRKVGVDTQPLLSEMEFVTETSKSPYKFIYSDVDFGKKVWYVLRYYNFKGEFGPWSEIKVALVN